MNQKIMCSKEYLKRESKKELQEGEAYHETTLKEWSLHNDLLQEGYQIMISLGRSVNFVIRILKFCFIETHDLMLQLENKKLKSYEKNLLKRS